MPEICQEIPQKSYGLRLGVKHAAQAKKIVKTIPSKQNLPINQKQIVKERRENEEQRIQTPFQNNHVRDDESYEIDEGDLDDLEEQEHSISQFDDDSSSHFLTKDDYHYATVLIMKKMIIKCPCLKFVRRFHRNHIVLYQG